MYPGPRARTSARASANCTLRTRAFLIYEKWQLARGPPAHWDPLIRGGGISGGRAGGIEFRLWRAAWAGPTQPGARTTRLAIAGWSKVWALKWGQPLAASLSIILFDLLKV